MPRPNANAAQQAAFEREQALQAHARALQLAQAHLRQNPPAAAGPPKGLTPAQQAAPAAAPAAPTFQPDSIYNDSLDIAHRNYLAAIGAADNQERDLKFDYNDPSNAFNRVAESKKKFLQQGNGIQNSLAARGLLYSTSMDTQTHANAVNGDQDLANLRQTYERALAGVTANRGDAERTQTSTALRLLAEARQRQGLN